MKTIGIQIKSNEAIIVVLEKDSVGNIIQTKESAKFEIGDPTKPNQVKQFRDQINTDFDSIGASRIGVVARNANGKGQRAPSPISFKLEGIIQLYDKLEVELVWPQTTIAYFKRNPKTTKAKNKYQEDAFDVAYFLINQK
jgi:hypothetical protein